jgi:hypothetical protein
VKEVALPEPRHDEALAPPAVESEQPVSVKAHSPERAATTTSVGEASTLMHMEDPELSAQAFAERNQKEAEQRLKALTAEAESLRTRLNKLESGIKMWENLLNSLKAAQQWPVTSTAVTAGSEEAGDLEPIRSGSSGGTRSEKKLKWSTAAGSASAPAAPVNSAGIQLPSAGAVPTGTTSAPPPVQAPVAPPAQAVAPGLVPR